LFWKVSSGLIFRGEESKLNIMLFSSFSFEALARECVAVALSPDCDFVLGKTFVAHLGASGNMSTVIRRRLPTDNEAVDVHFVSRVCSEESWVSYWLCSTRTGRVFVGVGKIPGQQCIGVMDDSLYHQLRPDEDAVRYVGLGNSALGKTAQPLKMRNVAVMTVPDSLQTKLENLSNDDFPLINIAAEGDNDEVQNMMEAYNSECKKAKARARKFGIPYKEPNSQAFQNWSKLQRLRANPQKGFATGMDISAPEELEKQQARAARFGTGMEKRDRTTYEEEEEEMMNAEMEEEENQENPIEEDALPLEEAWDNEELVQPHRFDPPKTLWVKPPDTTIEEDENQAVDSMETAILTPDKIHLCSIDWAAFKQIRTDDIMAHFSIYGPSYVEWLGEVSCNILFQDKFSASRALQNLAQQLPTPPPHNIAESLSESPDLGNMGWCLGSHPVRKIANDRFGRRGTKARFLLRVAASTDVLMHKPESTPAPPPGFSTTRVLGPGIDYDDSSQMQRPKKRRKREMRREPQRDSQQNSRRESHQSSRRESHQNSRRESHQKSRRESHQNSRRESQQNPRRESQRNSRRESRRDFKNKKQNEETSSSGGEHPLLSKGLTSSR